jgi:hypothetical protein
MTKKSGVSNGDGKSRNRSDAVREALAQHPKATTKEVIDLLAGKGVKVSSTLVYYVRSKQNQARRRERRDRVDQASRATPAANPVELVARVKALAREVGGIAHLKQLVDLLAE